MSREATSEEDAVLMLVFFCSRVFELALPLFVSVSNPLCVYVRVMCVLVLK